MNNSKSNQEEIDLGQLFNAIGRLFKRFFEFIGEIINKLFLAFVWLIFLIKKHIVPLAIALIIGFAIGFFLLNTETPKYKSSALLKQNYPIGENLYLAIENLNGLIAENDAKSLAGNLGITEEEAGKVKSFSISADFNENDKIVIYNDYFENRDTTMVYISDFETFAQSLNDFDYQFQKIELIFEERGLFNKTLDGLVENLNSIDYYKNLQKRDFREIERRKENILRSLAESDSLKKVYAQVLKMPIEGKESQTSITIDNGDSPTSITKEYDLFLNDIELMNELVDLERRKEDLSNIVEVITTVQNIGVRHSKYAFLGIDISLKYYYAVLLFGLTLMFLLVKELLIYLEKFKNKF